MDVYYYDDFKISTFGGTLKRKYPAKVARKKCIDAKMQEDYIPSTPLT